MSRDTSLVICVLVFVCLLAGFAAAQTGSPPVPQTEQIETGTVPAPENRADSTPHEGLVPVPPQRQYRIRLLPVSSFPQLPITVAKQLEDKGCMIPQTYEAREPENVIYGSFEKNGSDDWAVLCSVNRISTLYVFFQSNYANAIPLRHQPDSEWLGVEWSLDYGSAWGISTHPARLIGNGQTANHDAIDDSHVEHASTLRYYDQGKWTTLDTGQ